MTKLFTSAAVLMLREEGTLELDDPIGRYLPALSLPRVLAGGSAEAPLLVDAQRAVTIRDLLTHTSGVHLRRQPSGRARAGVAARERLRGR